MKRLFTLIVLLGFLGVVAGCTQSNTPTESSTNTPSSSASTNTGASTNQ